MNIKLINSVKIKQEFEFYEEDIKSLIFVIFVIRV